jgi:hypothetical protein
MGSCGFLACCPGGSFYVTDQFLESGIWNVKIDCKEKATNVSLPQGIFGHGFVGIRRS